MHDFTISMPAYEICELPSKGFLGGPAKLEIRPMTMREEKFFTNKTLAKNGKIQQAIFSSCIGKAWDKDGNQIENFEVGDLLMEDEYALLIFLRIISYGDDYDVKITCPDCEKKREYTVSLEKDVDVIQAEENIPQTIEITLPVSKVNITMRYPTSSMSGKSTSDMLSKMIIKATKADGTSIPKESYDMFINSLIGRDSSEIKKAAKSPFGAKKTLNFSCQNEECDSYLQDQEVPLPITGEFFRLSDT